MHLVVPSERKCYQCIIGPCALPRKFFFFLLVRKFISHEHVMDLLGVHVASLSHTFVLALDECILVKEVERH